MTAYIKAIATNYEKDGFAWHKEDAKNDSLTETDNVTSAFEKAKIENVDVVKAPIGMILPDGTQILSKKSGLLLTGVPWTPNGIQDLERQVSWYEGISNARYAEILNPLAETYNVGSVLHCGPLGEVLAIQFKMPDFMVGDKDTERHVSYLLVAEDRKTGKKHYHVTNTRVVCANTYAMAIQGVKSLPNGQDAEMMLVFRTTLEQAAIESRKRYIASMNDLFTKKVTKEQVTAVANVLFPMPNRPSFLDMVEKAEEVGFDFNAGTDVANFATEKQRKVQRDYQAAMDRQEQYLSGFFGSYARFNDEHTYAGETAYALWNAATETQRPESSLYGRTDHDVAAYNLFFGNRAKSLDSVYSYLTK